MEYLDMFFEMTADSIIFDNNLQVYNLKNNEDD